MPIVTLKEALKKAKAGNYAVGMFNAINIETIQGILLAAEQKASPVILSLLEVDWWYVETDLVIRCMAEKARSASVPVVLHYDHGHDLETMKKLLDAGWSSLMIDASTRSLEENIGITASVVEMAKNYGASVEGELGHVLGIEGKVDAGDRIHMEDLYTKVDEAARFVEQTGVDALAVAIGTVHGEYRFVPQLNFQRLDELNRALEIPLVLHGGSGLSEEDFKRCIGLGIRKINIFTEIMVEAGKATGQPFLADPDAKIAYMDLIPVAINNMKENVGRFMTMFGSTGKM